MLFCGLHQILICERLMRHQQQSGDNNVWPPHDYDLVQNKSEFH